jgi:kinesin family member 21
MDTNESSESVSVKVAARVRPLIGRELNETGHECVSIFEAQKAVIIGKARNNDHYDHPPLTTGTAFHFDYVYGGESEQRKLFEESIVPLLDACLEGHNSTVFAYGQTGSGKSYTMGTAMMDHRHPWTDRNQGSESDSIQSDLGVIPRAMYYLFEKIRDDIKAVSESRMSTTTNSGDGVNYDVKVTFLELYNEDLLDLLASWESKPQVQPLVIREEFGGGIYVAGVAEINVKTVEAALECLKSGLASRKTASTDMNDMSSRSHAIFTVSIERLHYAVVDSSEPPVHTFSVKSKFHFVDLAGSERLKRTNAIGERAKEGIAINQGLLALGNVISALSENSRKGGHIPYRDSKLTRLLQDSLGGNSRTLMIVCISPVESSFAESINSLNYASRAKNIKNRSIVSLEFSKNNEELVNLRRELHLLKSQMTSHERVAHEMRKFVFLASRKSWKLPKILDSLDRYL